MIKNYNKNTSYGILKKVLNFILVIFLFLLVYRTIYPIKQDTEEIFSQEIFKPEEIILQNEKIALTINLRGAMLEHFYFKESHKHYLFQNNLENCFETMWISKSNKISLPGRNTIWTVKNIVNNNNKSVIQLVTDVNSMKFFKTITIEEYKVTIEDHFTTNNNFNMEDILMYGGFTCAKENQDNLEFIGYLNNKKKVLRVLNRSLQKGSKQKISSHDSILGIENKFFLCICQTDEYNSKQGNIFLQNNTEDNNSNQMFILSIGTSYKQHELYLLPKIPQLLEKYQFNNLFNYGTVLFPLTYSLSKILNFLLQYINGILALLLMALLIIFTNIFLILLIEKEKFKLQKNDEEKKSLEANYTGRELEQQLAKFYKKHDIKMLRIIMLPLLMSFSWFTLNWAIGFSFDLRKQGFLWLQDLSLPDTYSIFNLYGLLNFSPNVVPFFNYLASDILSIYSAIFMIMQTNQVLANNKKNGLNDVAIPNNLLMIIHYILFLSMCKSVSSGFVLCFLIISIGNFFTTKFIKYNLNKKI